MGDHRRQAAVAARTCPGQPCPARSRREPAPRRLAWRPIRARLLVCAAMFGLWTAGDRGAPRLPAGVRARRPDEPRRPPAEPDVVPPAKRGEIVDRNGQVLAYSVDADTIAAIPTDIDDPARRGRAGLRRARRLHRGPPRRRLPKLLAKQHVVRLHRAPGDARARPSACARSTLPGITLLKESRRYYPNSELAAHVRRLRRPRQRRARRDRVGLRLADPRQGRQDPDPDRRQAARDLQPRRAAGHRRRGRRADDRSVPAVHRRARAAGRRRGEPRARRHGDHHGSEHRRDPGAGELSDLQSERVRASPTTTRAATARSRTSTSPARRSRS